MLFVWWAFAERAAGPGMRLMRLQLVGFYDGRPIGWIRFLLRALVLAALTATGIGLLLMLIFLVMHPRKQGWHDLLVHAVVIKQRALAPEVQSCGRAATHTRSDDACTARSARRIAIERWAAASIAQTAGPTGRGWCYGPPPVPGRAAPQCGSAVRRPIPRSWARLAAQRLSAGSDG